MEYSLKTQLILFCVLLISIMTVGQIFIWSFSANTVEPSQKFTSVISIVVISVLLCLLCVFKLIVPRITDPITTLIAACDETEIGMKADAANISAIAEFNTLAARLCTLYERLQEKRNTLSKGRNLLRSLIDTLPDLIYIKDTEHRFLVANAALAKHIGVKTSDELLGKSDIDLLPFKFASRYYEDEREVLESGKAMLDRVEPGIELKSGAKHWFLSSKIPYYDHNGKIEGIIGIGRDITRLEQELEALQELVSGLSWENLFLSEERKTGSANT